MGLRSARGCRKVVKCHEDAENRSVQSPLRSGPGTGTPCLLSHSTRKNKSQDHLGLRAGSMPRPDRMVRKSCCKVHGYRVTASVLQPATWCEYTLSTNYGIGITCRCNNPQKNHPSDYLWYQNVDIKSRNNIVSSGCVRLHFQVKKPWEQLHPTWKDYFSRTRRAGTWAVFTSILETELLSPAQPGVCKRNPQNSSEQEVLPHPKLHLTYRS